MKIGIALSGGGIRGIAHAGVLQALLENNINIDVIGGTSSGSMVASLYAMGYEPSYIYKLFKKHAKEIAGLSSIPILSGIGYFMNIKKNKIKGLKTGNEIEEVFNKLASEKNIYNVTDIKMPIVVPTVDIKESKEYVFTNYIPHNDNKYISDIQIGKMIRASSSFPAVFSPCNISKHAFLDGGALDNIPVVEVRKQGADKVIAVKFTEDKIDSKSYIMDIVMKTIDIMGSKIAEESLKNSDIILNIKTNKTRLLEMDKLEECYKYGYSCAMERMQEIKNMIKNNKS